MAAIFQSLGRTVIAGLVILVVAVLITTGMTSSSFELNQYTVNFIMRWLHVLAGVMWIGLLWYFNFVQIPSMPKIPDEQKPAIGKVIAPTALFWFRYAALATVVTGLLLAHLSGEGYLVGALSLQAAYIKIGLGMWMALIMAANVWFIIWPNQKKALGIVSVEADAKAAAAKMAMMASRINTILSNTIIWMMVAQTHGAN
jgi:uncharacterized membrane protein